MLAYILETTNRGKRDYKQEQLKGFQIGAKRLQIGAKRFQIGATITNRCRTAITVKNLLWIKHLPEPVTFFTFLIYFHSLNLWIAHIPCKYGFLCFCGLVYLLDSKLVSVAGLEIISDFPQIHGKPLHILGFFVTDQIK